MTRQQLLKSKEHWTLQIQSDLYEVIKDYMRKNNLNRSDLAKKYNVSKGYITQIMNGNFDHKLSKLVDMSLKAGKVPILHFVDLEKYIEDDKTGKVQNGEMISEIFFSNMLKEKNRQSSKKHKSIVSHRSKKNHLTKTT